MELVVFYCFAVLSVAASLMVVFQRRALYSALALIVCLGSVAILFFQLGAQFIGAIQIIVYAGAIMVLFLFVIMLLDPQSELFPENRLKRLAVFGFPLALLFFLVLAGRILRETSWASPQPASITLVENTREIARILFSRYLLPFELTSILILVAVIGAVVLAKRPN